MATKKIFYPILLNKLIESMFYSFIDLFLDKFIFNLTKLLYKHNFQLV